MKRTGLCNLKNVYSAQMLSNPLHEEHWLFSLFSVCIWMSLFCLKKKLSCNYYLREVRFYKTLYKLMVKISWHFKLKQTII